jgi:hypothetical protein
LPVARGAWPGLDTTGRVSESEHADDGGTYSVEVIVEGGRHIEVKLDDNVHVIKQANDDDSCGHDGLRHRLIPPFDRRGAAARRIGSRGPFAPRRAS